MDLDGSNLTALIADVGGIPRVSKLDSVGTGRALWI